ncbi:MAG: JmjC domain-containing protein, partial [Allosphingosinicella sp.]
MTITLLDLLGPQGMDAILQAMADRRLAHLPDSGAVGRLQLFPVDDMESFLLRGAVAKSLTVSINGRPVDLELMGVLRKERLRPLTLRKLMRQGASLVLNDLDRHLPQLWDLACDAERRFQDRVRIVAVGSFSRMPVFTAHYDPWDLIIIQIEGTKTWNLLGEPADCGVRNHPRVAVPAEVSATVEMRPGDILFVPAGLHHQCVGETFSLHLSLAIERATVRNVIEDLFSRLPALNRPFRAVLGPEALKRQVESIREEIVAQLGEIDVAAWLGNWNAA